MGFFDKVIESGKNELRRGKEQIEEKEVGEKFKKLLESGKEDVQQLLQKVPDLFHVAMDSIQSASDDVTLQENAGMENIDVAEHDNVIQIQPQFLSRFDDEYTVEAILGVGGFGIVFEATHKLAKCKYAVKRIPARRNEVEDKLREVQAMAAIEHAGIVRFHSAWIETPPPFWQVKADMEMFHSIGPSSSLYETNYSVDTSFIFIQMQLCKYSLARWLDENREPHLRSIARTKIWMKQITSAIDYIHDKNLIHRDLKPANILFFEENTVKVCDLGISTVRAIDGHTETYRTDVGTVMYMSPEQNQFPMKYSSKTDVFGLGLILIELYTWKPQIEFAEMFYNLRNGQQCVHLADEETAKFVKMLTQMDPKCRPSCKEMLEHPYLCN